MTDIMIGSIGMSLADVEKHHILKNFEHFRGNKTVTANALGISIRTLDKKLELYEKEKEIEAKRAYAERVRQEEWLMRARGNPPNNLGIPYEPSSNAYQNQKNGVSGSDAGVRMESPSDFEKEWSVSVPKREEV